MSTLKKLLIEGSPLGISEPISKVEIFNRRSYLVDSFVVIPEVRHIVSPVIEDSCTVSLLRNTYGSFYEVIIYGAKNQELLRSFFIMPDADVALHSINLLTSYPEVTVNATSFLQLSDTPDSYFGHAGKKVVVKQDETGLEFEGEIIVLDFLKFEGSDDLILTDDSAQILI